jgi:hypothetical protein
MRSYMLLLPIAMAVAIASPFPSAAQTIDADCESNGTCVPKDRQPGLPIPSFGQIPGFRNVWAQPRYTPRSQTVKAGQSDQAWDRWLNDFWQNERQRWKHAREARRCDECQEYLSQALSQSQMNAGALPTREAVFVHYVTSLVFYDECSLHKEHMINPTMDMRTCFKRNRHWKSYINAKLCGRFMPQNWVDLGNDQLRRYNEDTIPNSLVGIDSSADPLKACLRMVDYLPYRRFEGWPSVF